MRAFWTALAMAGGLAGFAWGASAKGYMPPGFEDVELGMTTEDLLKARPGISSKNVDRDVNFSASDLILFERPDSKIAGFRGISYLIAEGHLVSVNFSLNTSFGKEREARRELLKKYRALWGKEHERRTPEDSIRKGKALPAVVWKEGDVEVALLLPADRAGDDRKVIPVGLQIRKLSKKTKPIIDVPMDTQAKKKFFKENDVED